MDNTESILSSIKKLLGPGEDDTQFDDDITMHINSAIMRLNQLGIGPPGGYSITDKTNTWGELIGARKDLDAVKSYIYLKVRLIFDPPQSGFLIDAIKSQITELDSTLNMQAEGGTT